MKKFDSLTVSEFVELACGDLSVLLGPDESAGEEELALAARGVMLEYKSIADPSGMRGYLIGTEEAAKARLTLHLMEMCREMTGLGRTDLVRAVLAETGADASRMSDARVEAEVLSRIAMAKRTLNEYVSDGTPPDPSEVRRMFDGQMAAMMAHYRFQFDASAMKASVYAHLVARYIREIKAMEAASKRR